MNFAGPAKSIAVLGGGLTGLVAAHRLAQLGHRVRLFERGRRVGGAIRTEIAEGWLIEAGPNSFQASPEMTELLRELDLENECLEPSPVAKNRYIARGPRAIALPASPAQLLATPLFSGATKLRVLRELFTSARTRTTDCSVATFAREHFGQEVLDYVVQPFVSGVYAGDAETLSLRHAFPKLSALEQRHGSLLRGQIATARERRKAGQPAVPRIFSFKRGLETLPLRLASRFSGGALALEAQVDRLVPGKFWQVIWHNSHATHTETFDAVVAALPAPALARLVIGEAGREPLASLAAIPHPPVSSLFLGFKRAHVAHPLDGFGLLVPACEKRAVLGVLFSSTLFAGRAPAGHVALTVLVGGALRPELAGQPVAALIDATRQDLRDLLGVDGVPVFSRHTFWSHAIPQYELGYERQLETMRACEQAHPGFFIGGQARDGISLPNCLAAGEKLATSAARYLK